ncbi:MAG TPA: hypothetical protein VF131_03830 [Blastocatellia bacterium]|nr:hypothetical protein [Blastocatellia bacterium]
MSRGEFFTRFTIWVTLAGYSVGVALFALSRKNRRRERAARLVWTIACISLLAHVACAFYFYHDWSHDSAYRETARQTAEVVGLNWGGGLYINYALMACWVADVAWWWRGLDLYRRRPVALVALWQGFLIFMFFNATVVFETGALRFIGLFLCLALCLLWRRSAASGFPHGQNKGADIIVKD